MSTARTGRARPRWGLWTRFAVRVGLAAAAVSRRLGLGEGSIIGGRVTLRLHPAVLSRLVAGRRVVVVSGTNGKTTTSHLLAAALRTAGAVAHNASGSNMADGVVAALCAAPTAPFAVLEVDELHLARITAAVHPDVVVVLNLTRDQLDRGSEVRAVATALRVALGGLPATTVIANADDPMVVAAVGAVPRPLWVSAGAGWSEDTTSCPRCAALLVFAHTANDRVRHFRCGSCGLTRPTPQWSVGQRDQVQTPAGAVSIRLGLPGRFNVGNAVMVMAAAHQLGVEPVDAAAVMAGVDTIAGRYALVRHGDHQLRMLLAKNPAGFAETLGVLVQGRSLLVVVNAREADGRDTSWLWDVEFEQIAGRTVIACGQRAADVGLRLSYADIEHATIADPLAGLALLPPGKVDVIANYTAFHQLNQRLTQRPSLTGQRAREAASPAGC